MMPDESTTVDGENDRLEVFSALCARHNFSPLVLESLYRKLAKNHCRIWMNWASNCTIILDWSAKYLTIDGHNDDQLKNEWDRVIERCSHWWEKLVMGSSVVTDLENPEEYLEQGMLDEEEIQYLNNDTNL
jgi:hypothetical protein